MLICLISCILVSIVNQKFVREGYNLFICEVYMREGYNRYICKV